MTRGQVANYGIMDQMAVLQWIQENIVQFGGDPQKVTLFGHGTGAACIEYLTHSPTTVPGKNFNPIFIGLVEDYIYCSGQYANLESRNYQKKMHYIFIQYRFIVDL